MTSPANLEAYVVHSVPGGTPQRDLLIRMAQEIELLKVKVFGKAPAAEPAPDAKAASAAEAMSAAEAIEQAKKVASHRRGER